MDINDNVRPSEDPTRPWKHYKVPSGSTVGSVLSQFPAEAKHQYLQVIMMAGSKVGLTRQESLDTYQGILKSAPVQSTIGLLPQISFNRTFRPSYKEGVDTTIIREARSGISKRYTIKDGEVWTAVKWRTNCSNCSERFRTGERVVEMDDGDWRHYWKYPMYGQSFKEILDIYREKSEHGDELKDGSEVWTDLTRTRFSHSAEGGSVRFMGDHDEGSNDD
jgi:hypothetical protein